MERPNPKLFDRSSYSSTTVSVFQVVGAYFVDIYYNHLYTEAVKFKTDGKASSVTEGYRHATFAFLSALDNKAKGYKPENYNKLLQGINEYFIFWTNFSSLTISECIDKIVREFVPADYFASLNKEQKRNILRQMLIDSIREFTKIVIGEFLGAIIDNHGETANVEALKEKMVDVFILQRETLFHKFIDCRAGGKPDEKVDKRFLDKLRNEVIRLNTVNESLTQENKHLATQLDTVRTSAEEVVQRFKKLKMRYDAITQEYRISKDKVNGLEDALRSRRTALDPESNIFEDDDEDIDDDENSMSIVAPAIIAPAVVSQPTQPKPALKAQPALKPTQASIQKAQPKPTLQPALNAQPTPAATLKAQPALKPTPASIQKPQPALKPTPQPKPTVQAVVQKQALAKQHLSQKEDSSNESDESEEESSEEENEEVLPSESQMDDVLAKHIITAKLPVADPPKTIVSQNNNEVDAAASVLGNPSSLSDYM